MKRCEICDAPMAIPQRKTCSEACKKEKKRRYDAVYLQEVRHAKPLVFAPTCTTKHCPQCNTTKPVNEFGRNARAASGLQSFCKVCRGNYAKQPKRAARDKKRKAQWYVQQRDSQALRAKATYEKHREQINAKNRERYHADPEKYRRSNKARYRAIQSMIRRVCVCGRGFYVPPGDGKRFFCSYACRAETRLEVCRSMVKALRAGGVLAAVSHTTVHSELARGQRVA